LQAKSIFLHSQKIKKKQKETGTLIGRAMVLLKKNILGEIYQISSKKNSGAHYAFTSSFKIEKSRGKPEI
jgi:hypothetical protein